MFQVRDLVKKVAMFQGLQLKAKPVPSITSSRSTGLWWGSGSVGSGLLTPFNSSPRRSIPCWLCASVMVRRELW